MNTQNYMEASVKLATVMNGLVFKGCRYVGKGGHLAYKGYPSEYMLFEKP